MSAEAERCPCGGGDYERCCGPRHTGAAPAPTAEALMRSRYSAYVRGLAAYLAATQRAPLDEQGTLSWAGAVKWLGLTVHWAKGGEGADAVEFTAPCPCGSGRKFERSCA